LLLGLPLSGPPDGLREDDGGEGVDSKGGVGVGCVVRGRST